MIIEILLGLGVGALIGESISDDSTYDDYVQPDDERPPDLGIGGTGDIGSSIGGW